MNEAEHEVAQLTRTCCVATVSFGSPFGRVGIGIGELGGAVGLFGEHGEPLVPVGLATDHTGVARQPLPRGGRDPTPVDEQGRGREPRHHVLPAEVVLRKSQQLEQDRGRSCGRRAG